MSKTTHDNPVIEIAPEAEIEQTEAVKEPNFFQKSVRYVKTHKKATIAVVGLGGLVGASALLGRKTAPSPTFEPLELEPVDVIDVEVLETTDDTVTA